MKRFNLHHVVMALSFMLFSFSFGSCTTAKEREAESELQQFTNWVDRQSTQVANFSEEQWKDVKQEYKQQVDNLDQTEDKLSDEGKELYRSTKNQFQEWDRELEQRFAEEKRMKEQQTEMAMSAEMEKELLGDNMDVNTLSAANMRDTYISFMQKVRRKKDNWTEAEWEQAEQVLKKLNNRKDQVSNLLSMKDKAKITALQMEFQSLQTGSDLEDVYKNEIKDTYKDVKD
ncbi:MAG: hypothetical protein LPK19_03420 [Hymenobacteraceae bacterium]|nr:hypothetical protein [Hymenobacteraceae bacterium]MDX5395241.1 hypothetical protein [Hymenobacteraceae bacterium]MDX5511279.1 hypothetical protein [Hymenobacteraceae bacterium]